MTGYNFNLIRYFNRLRGMGDNSKVVAKNTMYAFLIKGGALAITFFSTPLFIDYFNNNEVLGLWYTMLAVLSWFLSFDLGVGNGIRNHLVKAIAVNDRKEARRIISSGLFSTTAISLIMFLGGFAWIYFADLNAVFNISQELISPQTLRNSTVMVFCAIVLRFLLTSVSSIFYALQQASVNNFLAFLVSIMLFLYLIFFHFDNTEDALTYISFTYLWICNIPLIIAGIAVFCTTLRDCSPSIRYINQDTIRKIMGVGLLFFLAQIFYMIIANTNEWFISHYWNPSFAADYGFYYRISMLPGMMISLALTPTWSMVTKAYTCKDYTWLRKLNKLFSRMGILVIGTQFLLIPFLQFMMDIWLGDGILIVDYNTALAFACFGSAFIYSSMLSTIVAGLTKIGLQLCCYGIGAVLKIAFIISIHQITNDWTWVVWANVFVLTIYCILQQISLNRMFRKAV